MEVIWFGTILLNLASYRCEHWENSLEILCTKNYPHWPIFFEDLNHKDPVFLMAKCRQKFRSICHAMQSTSRHNNFTFKSPCQMHRPERHRDLGLSEGNHQLTEQWRANNDHHWPAAQGMETLLCHFNTTITG